MGQSMERYTHLKVQLKHPVYEAIQLDKATRVKIIGGKGPLDVVLVRAVAVNAKDERSSEHRKPSKVMVPRVKQRPHRPARVGGVKRQNLVQTPYRLYTENKQQETAHDQH